MEKDILTSPHEVSKGSVPSQIRKFQEMPEDLLHALAKLRSDEPFYGYILRYLHKIPTDKIPTAGVTTKSGEYVMYYNPEFFKSLTKQERVGLLKHECMHIVLGHTITRRWDPHWVSNYAQDLAINSMIPEEELPKCGLVPGKPFPVLAKEELAKMKPEAISRYAKISLLVQSFEKGLSSEEYFGLLMRSEVVKEMERERKANEEAFGKMLKEINDALGSDDHSTHGDEGAEAKGEEGSRANEAVNRVKAWIKDAIEKADMSQGWGSVSASMREEIKKSLENELDWRSYLRNFIHKSIRAGSISSWTRANRKAPFDQPGVTRDYRPNIYVFFDQSGSVDDNMLVKLFSELLGLQKFANFFLVNFDTEIDLDSLAEYKQGSSTPPGQRTRCGGTDFNAPTRFVNEERMKRKIDAGIILTDGCAPEPEFPVGWDRLWVLPAGCKLMWDEKRDSVAILKKEAKDYV